MSTTTRPLHPSKRHPLTGRPLQAAGVLPSGRIVWPILGGDDTVPPVERPDGVTEEEWNALNDPGKAAIVRERSARAEAERKLAAAQARPAPPKPTPAPAPAPAAQQPAPGETPDIAKLVSDAVASALKPFEERESQRTAEEAAGKVRDTVLDAAKERLHDATDALQIDLRTVLDENGATDAAKVTKAIDDLLAAKPHLAKSTTRFAPPGIGGGTPAATGNQKEQVAAILAGMQTSAGVRVPTNS